MDMCSPRWKRSCQKKRKLMKLHAGLKQIWPRRRSTTQGDDDMKTMFLTKPAGPDTEDGSQEQVFQLKSDFNVIKVTEDGYEGAIVLTPKPNIYFEPITVLDFASLYPSEMIASDLSHDRIIEDECWLGDEGAKRLDALGI